jgi:hypothetical protein
MSEEPLVPIVCTECDTETEIPLDEVADTVENHNERLHDGEDVATVDPELKDQLADVVAQDMGLLDDAESAQ